jgi:hypothetical protein
MLYEVNNNILLWSGDLSITDPTDINSAAQQVAQAMFNDWVASNC